MTSSAPRKIGACALKAMLHDGGELALVDVREQGVYFHGHLLFASCIPLSRIELLVADLIPRRGTRIVLCDGGDEDLAARAATTLTTFGYDDVSIFDGGTPAWREAGFELFSGVNVVSKAFGEYVEHRYHTPRLSAQDLAAMQAAGEDLIVLDSRPFEEFHNMSIPGGIDCPGAELAYRAFGLVHDPRTLVVVNCAGRTRSIIGAQSLINAGLPNRVVALKDGTMGWELAGLEVARGRTERAPAPTAAALAQAQAAAAKVAARFGVRSIDRAQLAVWQAEREQRTLYVLDVRTAEEYAAGHLPGSRHAPGGQLVQATDEYVATRNARIVLVDDCGVRASMTASWLKQMGWDEVYVLTCAVADELEGGPPQATLLNFVESPTISSSELKEKLDADSAMAVLDFATSLQYRKQHIPGAYWAVRSRLHQALSRLASGVELVVTSPDAVLAHYAARDIADLRERAHLRVLKGGTSAWIARGLPIESGTQRLTCEANDVWYKPYEQRERGQQAMQEYLTWEVNLVRQIERDGDARFR
jgi:rhodanese-related sulfurtransferase